MIEEGARPRRDTSEDDTRAPGDDPNAAPHEDLIAVLSIVSHDLKNPLVSVKGLAQLIRRRAARMGTPDGEWIAERADQIDQSSNRIVALINDLVDAARLQLGESLRLDLRSTDIVELVERVAQDVRQRSDVTPVETHHAVGETPAVADVDPVRLARAIGSLVANAIKYGAPGAAVTIRVRREEPVGAAGTPGAVSIAVENAGESIPVDLRDRLFARSGRIAPRRDDHTTGTGLPLPGVASLVRQHGGTIDYAARPGGGSIFTVSVPLSSANGGW